MKNRLNNIRSIEYTRCSDITLYRNSQSGKAVIETNVWTEIKKGVAPSMLNINKQETEDGSLYTTDMSFNLLETINEPSPVVLKVSFCDNETMLLGSPELPIYLTEMNQLIGKNVNISHRSWHYPFYLLDQTTV
ncbi:MAG TPA: hypothetical protein VKZ95_03450 [Sphingobacteriaceae bacterium]|nr:hypothetical protein [Sphingobacteriaceae bacterium]